LEIQLDFELYFQVVWLFYSGFFSDVVPAIEKTTIENHYFKSLDQVLIVK